MHCYIEVSLPMRNCGRNEGILISTDEKQLLGPTFVCVCVHVLLLLRNADMYVQQHIKYVIMLTCFGIVDRYCCFVGPVSSCPSA